MTLGTNLASRPFYNVRAVHAVLALLALVVIAFTAFNVFELIRLRGAESALGSHASESEDQAQKLRADATRIRLQIDQKELEAVSAAAREANSIIDRRAFSWTELLTQLEATLPAEVRITSVVPRLDEGVFKLALTAEARRAEDVDDFIETLEKTGAFHDVVPLRNELDDEGLMSVSLESIYTPAARETAKPQAPAPSPGGSRE
jgi:Tfp pilus assembly protein PilN